MEAIDLIGQTSSLGYPVPYYILVFFKVLGFTLHMVPMCLWFAGIVLAMGLKRWGSAHGQRFAGRLMNQMPILISMGINLGIVPLLFLQVAYYRAFYPATILMAWSWFSIVALLIVAYYGTYYYVVGMRHGKLTKLHYLAGWVSAVFFIMIGFFFSQGMALMTNIGAWPGMLAQGAIGGAPLGFAMNHGDTSAIARWLLIFGLALILTACYVVFDTHFFGGRESDGYKAWAPKFAFKLSIIGVVVYVLMASWYVFGAMPETGKAALFGEWSLLTWITAVFPAVPLLFIVLQLKGVKGALAFLGGLTMFLAIGLQAVMRQVVQNAELNEYITNPTIAGEPVSFPQWGVFFLFLLLFVGGIALVWWMVYQCVKVNRREMAELKGK